MDEWNPILTQNAYVPKSEGRGLSHEDERCYSGRIAAAGARTISVRGSVVFGTDLGTDARPEPVGTFSMMEMRGPA